MENSIKESFSRLLHEYGGYFELESINAPLRDAGYEHETEFTESILASCVGLVNFHLTRYKEPPIVHVAYLLNSRLGAVVTKDAVTGDYFIGIYYGSVYLLRAFFSRMLSSPRVLPWLGDISVEEPIKVDNPFMITGQALSDFLNNYPDDRVNPNDYERSETAKIMTQYAVQFLAMHELGHIVRGHLNYDSSLKKRIVPSGNFVESISSQNAKTTSLGLISQGLEFDADRFAVFHGASSCYQIAPSQVERSKMEWLEIWTVSVCSLFRILGLLTYDSKKINIYSHPPAGMRILELINGIGERLNALSQIFFDRQASVEEIKEKLGECISTVEKGIVDTTSDADILVQGFKPIVSAYFEEAHKGKVFNALDNIWSEVSKFKLQFVNP